MRPKMQDKMQKLFELIPTDDDVLDVSNLWRHNLEYEKDSIKQYNFALMKMLLPQYDKLLTSTLPTDPEKKMKEEDKTRITKMFFLFKILLSSCDDLLNSRDEKSGDTLLHFAVTHNLENVIQFLLHCGADTTIRNKNSLTAGMLAAKRVQNFLSPIWISGYFNSHQRNLLTDKKNSQEEMNGQQKLVDFITTYPTVGDGDCALHALLGSLNASNTHFYHDANTVRKELADKICEITNEENSQLFSCVLQNISNLVSQNEENVDRKLKSIKSLQEKYRELKSDIEKQIEEAKELLVMLLVSLKEEVVRIHHHLFEIENSQEVDDNNLLSYFIGCYTKDETSLDSLFSKSPESKAAYEEYTRLTNTPIDVASLLLADANLRKGVFSDYATYIGKPQQWLLPSDLRLFAFFKGIHVVYYPDLNAKPAHFNETAQTTVGIMFNGKDHYSRVPTIIEKPVATAAEKPTPEVNSVVSTAPESAFEKSGQLEVFVSSAIDSALNTLHRKDEDVAPAQQQSNQTSFFKPVPRVPDLAIQLDEARTKHAGVKNHSSVVTSCSTSEEDHRPPRINQIFLTKERDTLVALCGGGIGVQKIPHTERVSIEQAQAFLEEWRMKMRIGGDLCR